MLTWRIGNVTVRSVIEVQMPMPCNQLLPASDAATLKNIGWLTPHFLTSDGALLLVIQAFVVDTPTRRVVVDTCIGNDKPRGPGMNNLQTPFLADLAAAGYPRESIDVVLCTHLHLDHVGWNTMRVNNRWVPTFPNARYLFGKTEFEYWRDQDAAPDSRVVFSDSVQPVFDAGLVDLVANDHRICDEVSLVPTPGHTPGHVSIRVHCAGEEALISGDFIHHPCQLAEPDWSSFVDFDPLAAAQMRRRVFGELAGTRTLFIGTHFAAPTAGRIIRDGTTFRLAHDS